MDHSSLATMIGWKSLSSGLHLQLRRVLNIVSHEKKGNMIDFQAPFW
jgi:hypothetical protein